MVLNASPTISKVPQAGQDVNMNKSQKKAAKIQQKLKFFFVTLKLFGLAPFSIDEASSKFEMKFNSYLVLVVSIFSCICGFCASLHSFTIKSDLLDRIYQVTFLLQQFQALFAIIFSYFKRRNIESFWMILNKFDQTLMKLNWKPVEERFLCFNVFLAVFHSSLAAFIVFYCVDAHTGSRSYSNDSFILLKWIVYQLTNHFCLLIVVQFVLSVHLVQKRVTVLKDNME
jgi:hypothetical protein